MRFPVPKVAGSIPVGGTSRERGSRDIQSSRPPSSPISSRIGQVFIPVRDVAAAADWYARLLGIQPGDIAHHGTICDLPAEGDVRLTLDGNQPDFATDGPPRFFWWADDLHDVRRHLESIQAPDIGEITDIGSVAFLQFRDPDGSPLMVCTRLGH